MICPSGLAVRADVGQPVARCRSGRVLLRKGTEASRRKAGLALEAR